MSSDYADRLARIAIELAGRVRDDDPQANDRWLRANTTTQERHDLLYVLAAAIPDDRTWTDLTAWATTAPAKAAAVEALVAERYGLAA